MKLYVYAAIALALIGAALYVNRLQAKASRVTAAEARAEAAEKSITALQAAFEHDQRIAKEASDGYQEDLRRLEHERSNVPVVRLRKCPGQSVPTGSAAASRPDAAGEGHVSSAVAEDPGEGPDIGAELIEYGLACEGNALQLTRLQEWVRKR